MARKWTVLRIQEWNQNHYDDFGEPFLCVYDIKKPDIILWNGGPSYRTIEPERVQIVHIYSSYSVNDDYEKSWIAFYKTYRPLKSQPENAPEQSAGWLAPDGRFYTCHYAQHTRMADRITAILYNSMDGDVILERKGWLRIEDDGSTQFSNSFSRGGARATEAQEATLNRLASVGDGEWVRNMLQNLELYGVMQ
jgi:hypothetical protein